MSVKHDELREKLLQERKNMQEAAAKANAEVIAKFEG